MHQGPLSGGSSGEGGGGRGGGGGVHRIACSSKG